MRTEIEIRSALGWLGRDGENETPQLTDQGVLLPLNHMTKQILHWVLGEPSEFGSALAEVLARWDAAESRGEELMEPLTDREWYLVNHIQMGTLQAVIDGCTSTGLPGSIIAQQMLTQRGATQAFLRASAEKLLEEYKPDAA
jgi:hypothetical protein